MKNNNLCEPFSKNSPEIARQNQKKSVAARRKNTARKKTVAQLLEKLLNEKVTDKKLIAKYGRGKTGNVTYKELLVSSVILRTIEHGKIEDLLKLAELSGETAERQNNTGYLDELIDGLLDF